MAFGESAFYNTLINFLLFLLSPQMVMYFFELAGISDSTWNQGEGRFSFCVLSAS